MRRDLGKLEAGSYDLLVVGGGILGAFAAWQAVRRGLSVALVERRDFGSGTTAASGRVLHGGLRQLQHLDLAGCRRSLEEQRAVRRLAPDLLRRLRYVVPAREGHRVERLQLRMASVAWRVFPALLAPGSRGPESRYDAAAGPRGPGSPAGGALVYRDYQIRSPERLTIALIDEAVRGGARAANYAEAVGWSREAADRIGVRIVDRLGGPEGVVAARKVLLAAGVWTPALWRRWGLDPQPVAFAGGRHLLLDSPPPEDALALPWPAEARGEADRDGRIRRLFVSPWEGRTLAGASFEPLAVPGPAVPTDPEADARFLERMRRAFPALPHLRGRILHSTVGIYPAFGRRGPLSDAGQVSRKPLLVAHGAAGPAGRRAEGGGAEDIHSVVPAKLTTARAVAARALDRLFPATADAPDGAGPLRGTRGDLVALGSPAAPVEAGGGALASAVDHAVEEEMAQTLRDVMFRRTHVGWHAPPDDVVRAVADRVGAALGWDDARRDRELDTVRGTHRAGSS